MNTSNEVVGGCIIIELSIFYDEVITQLNHVPAPYQRNRQVKGVYLYVRRTFDNIAWEDAAKDFCKEILLTEWEGKGSVRKACKLIQSNWIQFVKWTKQTYKGNEKHITNPQRRIAG